MTQTTTLDARPEGPPPKYLPVEDQVRGAEAVVLLPTLNEEHGLHRVLGELGPILATLRGKRVQPLVIDGGSSDRTVAVAEEAGIPVLHQQSRGKGAAVVEAFDWLGRLEVPYVVVLDADATYPPDRVPPALALLRGGVDLVIGVRHPVWGAPRDFRDLVHRVGNVFLSGAASILTRRPILDLCSGFWAVPTARFRSLGVSTSSFAIEAELVLKALREGYQVRQIPVAYRERVGQAKLRAARDGFRIFESILIHGRRSWTPATDEILALDMVPQLLSIGAISGTSTAIVHSDPARFAEAHSLRRALNAGFLETSVSPAGPTPPQTPPAAGAPANPSPPLVIRLVSGGSEPFGARSTTVSIRSQRRQLTIELDHPAAADSPAARDRESPTTFSRAGAFSTGGPGTGSPTGRVLRSRLDVDPVHRKASLLAANGFRVTEVEAASPEPPPARRSVEPPALFGSSTH